MTCEICLNKAIKKVALPVRRVKGNATKTDLLMDPPYRYFQVHYTQEVCVCIGMLPWALGKCHGLEVIIIMSAAANWHFLFLDAIF